MAARTLGEMATLRQKLGAIEGLMNSVSGGDPSRFVAESDVLRGAREGPVDPRMAEMLVTNEDQALADRFGWGGDIAQGSYVGPLALAPAIAYEGVKAVAPGLLGGVGRFLPQGEEMAVSSNTSKPSMANVAALIAGYQAQKRRESRR